MKVKLSLLLLVVGLLAAYFSYDLKSQSAAALERAEESLASMGKNATVMLGLQRQKSKIPSELKGFDQANIIGFIEGKIKRTGIGKSSISRMSPAIKSKDKKSAEVELRITISLKEVELAKVFTFLYNLEAAGIGLNTSSLKLDGAAKGEGKWNVQTVVACFIKRT